MPPITTSDTFVVGKTKAKLIYATPQWQAKIINGGGSKLFYKTEADVDTGDTEVAVGASVTVENVVFIISEGRSNVTIEHKEAPSYQDVTITDDLTVTDSLTVSGGATITPATAGFGAVTWQPPTAESGTDTAFAEKKLFVASIFLPYSATLTGVKYLLGAGGGTNKVIAALFDSAGKKVANSSETTEGTTAGTEKTVQTLAFTSTYAAKGPARYFIGITANGATAKLRTIPANTVVNGILTIEASLETKNVVPASITAPTEFVAAKGPVAGVY